MFKWEDGVKISNAKVNEDNTITPAEYEGKTPITAHNLNLAQQELLDDMGKRAIVKTTETIPENTDYTIPIKYKVGNGSLEIYYMGEKLFKDEHYIEVGENNSISNKIQWHDWGQAVPKDRIIEFVVRGDYSE